MLKNFGVTASGRVVFYDYDEVALVTDCRFRELPEPDDDLGLMDPGTIRYIGPHDIFPRSSSSSLPWMRARGTPFSTSTAIS